MISKTAPWALPNSFDKILWEKQRLPLKTLIRLTWCDINTRVGHCRHNSSQIILGLTSYWAHSTQLQSLNRKSAKTFLPNTRTLKQFPKDTCCEVPPGAASSTAELNPVILAPLFPGIPSLVRRRSLCSSRNLSPFLDEEKAWRA